MIVLVALLTVTLVSILIAPRLLRLGPRSVRHPRLLLAVWSGLFLTGGAAAAASLIWCAMLVAAFHQIDLPLSWAAGIIAWIALGATGAVSALVLTRADGFLSRRGSAETQIDLLAAACTTRTARLGATEVLYVRSSEAVAFSSTTGGGRVIISEALATRLDPAQLRAVIEHERAHLTGHHELLLRLAGLNRACLPGLYGARALDQTVHLLLEFAADDIAATRCGRRPLAAALTLLATDGNPWAAVRARRLTAHAAAPRRRSRAAPALEQP